MGQFWELTSTSSRILSYNPPSSRSYEGGLAGGGAVAEPGRSVSQSRAEGDFRRCFSFYTEAVLAFSASSILRLSVPATRRRAFICWNASLSVYLLSNRNPHLGERLFTSDCAPAIDWPLLWVRHIMGGIGAGALVGSSVPETSCLYSLVGSSRFPVA